MMAPRPDLRRGILAGFAVLVVLAPAVIARSDTPWLAGLEVVVVGAAAIAGATALALGIDRHRRR